MILQNVHTWVVLCGWLLVSSVHAESPVDFQKQIVPLLIDRCLECHRGSDPAGGLNLISRKSALQGGDSGKVIQPGNSDKSILWKLVASDKMPPKHPLKDDEKKLIQLWIDQNLPWDEDPIRLFEHTTSLRSGTDWWAFQPIVRPNIPESQYGDSSNSILSPIDSFIAAKFHEKKLTFSPKASRPVLIKRLYHDLLGLAPTHEEVQQFVNDPAPDAWEQLVQRTLASPQYGERWARHWLDVVRFGESDGFERNAPRENAWHYRNWVIDALNANMPYQQFAAWQLAGDQLAPQSVGAKIATGYLVNGIHNTVLPSLPVARETAFQDELEELVGNVGQLFLGLTINCARCHDHKYDPITQEDYYRFAANFTGVRHGESLIKVPMNEEQLQALTSKEVTLKRSRDQLWELAKSRLPKEEAANVGPAPLAAWDFQQSGKDLLGNLDVELHGKAKFTPTGLVVDGKSGYAQSSALKSDLQEKTLEAWVQLPTLNQAGGGVISIENGAVFDAIVFAEKDKNQWLAGSNFFRRTASFNAPQETEATQHPVHLAITYGSDGTITAYRNGKPYGTGYRAQELVTFPAGKSHVLFGLRHHPAGGNHVLNGTIIKARLYNKSLTKDEIEQSFRASSFLNSEKVLEALKENEKKQLLQWDAQLAHLRAEIARLAGSQLLKVYTLNTQQPPVTQVLARGQAANPVRAIGAGSLSKVSAKQHYELPHNAPEGERRKKIAQWLTSSDNPLFARVMVNRIWYYHFGTALVQTPSDFGFNGGKPIHADLLNWLTAEFIDSGFDIKKLHTLILTSATYQQASHHRPDAANIDRDNQYYWRKSPSRIEGEVLRDRMLQHAGVLNTEMGGKGFSDYQLLNKNGTAYFLPEDRGGFAQHRRSIYRFLPRSANGGLLDSFDCPDPASATPTRSQTTTPLQALSLWNGDFALRMVGLLTQRAEQAEPKSVDAQVTYLFQQVYQRSPTSEELALIRPIVQKEGLPPLVRALFNSNEFLHVE
ncbi:MAG: DUF1553 domain-containing protein [Zavarzinella sp.]